MGTLERILSLLAQANMSQKEFASALNIPPQVITDWKSGKSKSYERRLIQIAALLGTSVEYLDTGQKKEPATVSGSQPDFIIKFNSLAPDDQDEVLAIIEMKLAKKNKAP